MPSSPPTVLTAEVESHLVGVDELEQAQPLTRYLPHDTARFSIDYHFDDVGALVLEIELRAVLNRADQLTGYEAQLRASKAEALDWLQSVGADLTSLTVTYLPDPAAALDSTSCVPSDLTSPHRGAHMSTTDSAGRPPRPPDIVTASSPPRRDVAGISLACSTYAVADPHITGRCRATACSPSPIADATGDPGESA